MIFAIDPGNEKSAFVILDDEGKIVRSDIFLNSVLRLYIIEHELKGFDCCIEMIASYGMPVGKEVFETCLWIGRFMEVLWLADCQTELVYRKDVKLHLCGSARAKDANIRQALLDKYPRTGGGAVPQVGTKKHPGPLYGVSTHVWSALAVAVTFNETKRKG